ncbi:hypothetical protein AGABI2DRAFT_75124 [Agaricus bisporus var. bisporus H97]|uniref:hypothetical protein n=1 Tax=Agaricus bisporus var. bisporus (strain H97 / ATCC MYA-4626 / FGSC 10389) TaxID=936046 RepID=UPI00029F5791|nr:hypothetical protein AGABI2DRAFT_75124 [Agaricus bisporus var. bisporus H97]EKV44860.1 hypothetical protein AGABI2DRAFT_75124 [Agaricus bisporus var. bisporus H97]
MGTISGNHAGVESDESKDLSLGNCASPLEQDLETSKAAKEGAGNQSLNTEPEVISPSGVVSNPIEQSITAYRSGWASFFSSRKLVVKRIGHAGSAASGYLDGVERDENGMEIMEVDFDGDAKSADVVTDSDRDPNREVDMVGAVQTKGARCESKLGNAVVSRSPTTLDNTKRDRDAESSHQSQPTAPPSIILDGTRQPNVQLNVESDPAASKKQNIKSSSGPTTLVPSPSISSGQGFADPPAPSVPAMTAGGVRGLKRTASPVPSSSSPKKTHPPPNLVLPTWEDTFHVPPRSMIPPSSEIKREGHERSGGNLLGRAMGFVSGVLFSKDNTATGMDSSYKGKLSSDISDEHHAHTSAYEEEQQGKYQDFGKQLPRAWELVGSHQDNLKASRTPPSETPTQVARQAVGRFLTYGQDVNRDGMFSPGEQKRINDTLRGCRRVVVIGIHGWFPGTYSRQWTLYSDLGAVVRTVLGEFVNMMVQALENFQRDYEVSLESITRIPLEGEGTIERRVEKLYSNMTANQDWINDLHAADAIFVATHSQGSVVSTHLLNRLIRDGHICTSIDGLGPETLVSKPQRVCCLSLCGIHLGPLRYLSSSTFFQPYIQYFESVAARELFEFQVKMVYVASLNDQVVPIYSGLFTAVSHPLILRALYIDGAAYHSSDFLSNLLVLLLRILNSGISDSGLLAHLSEATAGSLNGVGHSTAYEEIATYSLAVKYLFLTDDGHADQPEVNLEPFNASHEQNDYEIPWALRDIIANEHVRHFFTREIGDLRDAFRDWHPKTTILRDLKRKLQPIQRLPSTFPSRGLVGKL